jgi:uncharacterized protein (TIGR02453 family)
MGKVNKRIDASSFDFLKQLEKNNNREWFNEHKDTYLDELLKMETFVEVFLDRMKETDLIDTPSGKKAMMRIYRDTRFSNNKTPYKNYWAGGFHRLGARLRGGYYFQFQPGTSFIAGGFWAPNQPDLTLIREEVAFDDEPMRKILEQKKIKTLFGGFKGEQLKTVPRGYNLDHPAADLLRYKQFILRRNFTDKQVFAGDFIDTAIETARALRPFFDYMSDVLVPPR